MVPAGTAEAAAVETVRQWMDASPELAVYRFAIEEVFRLQAHVLNEQGEKLLSLIETPRRRPEGFLRGAFDGRCAVSRRLRCRPARPLEVSYGQYRKLLATCRVAGRSPAGVRSAVRHLHRQPQHLRRDLQRRDAGRLVRGARARLPDDARCGAVRQRHSDQRRREPDPRDQERRGAVPPLSPAAQARAWPQRLLRLRRVRAAGRLRRALSPTTMCSTGSSKRCRRSAPNTRRACARAFCGALDRRLREPGQAQRRVFGAGLRRQSVHADELQRHARRGVHAGARARPLDAHACCRTRRSRSSTPATPSSWPKCRRR